MSFANVFRKCLSQMSFANVFCKCLSQMSFANIFANVFPLFQIILKILSDAFV